jgi:hypothetical protein
MPETCALCGEALVVTRYNEVRSGGIVQRRIPVEAACPHDCPRRRPDEYNAAMARRLTD